jgi:hypothetical protein
MSTGPLSVPLPDSLRKRLKRHAAKHHLKLATAVRSLVEERLSELEQSEQLTRAEEWQRAQVWAAWEQLQAEGPKTVSAERVHGYIDAAIQRLSKRRKNASAPRSK